MAKFNSLKFIVESLFTVVKDRSTPDEITFICPFCGDATGNRSVSLRNGKTNCWRCGSKPGMSGDFIKWCKRNGYEVDDAYAGMGDDDVEIDLSLTPSTVVPVYVVECALPSGFTPIASDPDCCYSRWIGDMARRKNLTWRSFADAGVGFCRGNGAWDRYAVFPICEWGKTVYFQGRLYDEKKGEPTKRFPPRTTHPHGSRNWVYNIDAARNPSVRTLIVVESILNVLSLKRLLQKHEITDIVPVALFKHSISKEQGMKIADLSHIQEINLMFDSDATDSAWSAVAKTSLPVEKVSVTEMPDGVDANDDVLAAWGCFNKRHYAASSAGVLHTLMSAIDCL